MSKKAGYEAVDWAETNGGRRHHRRALSIWLAPHWPPTLTPLADPRPSRPDGRRLAEFDIRPMRSLPATEPFAIEDRETAGSAAFPARSSGERRATNAALRADGRATGETQ